MSDVCQYGDSDNAEACSELAYVDGAGVTLLTALHLSEAQAALAGTALHGLTREHGHRAAGAAAEGARNRGGVKKTMVSDPVTGR